MSGIGRNQIISDIPNALLLVSPMSHPMTSHRWHILPPIAPVFFVEKMLYFFCSVFLRPLYYSFTPSLNNECC